MEMLITFAVKSLLVAGATLGMLHLLQARSAAERSMVAHLGLLALALFPLGSMFLPQLVVSVPLFTAAPVAMTERIVTPFPGASTSPTGASIEAAAPEPWWPLFYGLPVVLLLGATLLAVLRLLALRAKASVLVDPSWLSALAHAQRRMDFKHGTALLTSSELKSPISWGVLRPVILLNDEALGSRDEAEAIIAHELAHVRGLDWAKLLLGRIVTALFWFNPLVWILVREAHQLREETADDAVLAADVPGADYAQLLVGVARHDCNGMLLGAHGVAPGKGSLTRRVRRVLDDSLPRSRTGRGFAAGMFFGVFAAAAPLAAVTFTPLPAQGSTPLLAVIAPTPAESLPSLVAQSVATATLVTTEAVSVAVAGEKASTTDRARMEETKAVAATARAVADTDTAHPQAKSETDIAHLASKPHYWPTPETPSPPRPHPAAERAVDRALTNRAFGITPDYGAAIRAAVPGMRIDDSDLVGLRAVGVTPEWLRAMVRAGYRTSDIGDLTGARAVGVSPPYVAELSAAGLRNVSLGDLTAMRALGIDGPLIRGYRARGHGNLTPRRLIELRAQGLPGFAAGRTGPPPDWPPGVPRPPRAGTGETPPTPTEPDGE